jgi:hypothetical protein
MTGLLVMIATLCVNHSGFQTQDKIEACEKAMMTCTTKTTNKVTTIKSDSEILVCAQKLTGK